MWTPAWSAGLPGVVHHSDRGVQYASAEFVEILKQHRHGSEYEPASQPRRQCNLRELHQDAETREEIYANEYENLEDLLVHIEEFIERYYNQKRLHPALGYRTPEEFEQQIDHVEASTSATVKFFSRNDEESSTALRSSRPPQWGDITHPRSHPQIHLPGDGVVTEWLKA